METKPAIFLCCLLASLAACAVLDEDPFEKRYVWIGGTTSEGFRINLDVDKDDAELLVSTDAKNPSNSVAFRLQNPLSSTQSMDEKLYGGLRQVAVDGLDEATQYYVFLARTTDANEYRGDVIRVASVRTFPRVRGSVVIGLGSCQISGRNSDALQEIALWREFYAKKNPNDTFLMLHQGDLHYADIGVNEPARFERAVRDVVTDSGARRLFTTTQVSYTFDDHDFGPNNAQGNSPSGPAAISNYLAMVPHAKSDGAGTIWHSYSVGGVRIIVCDLRSESNRKERRMISAEQEKFLLDELTGWKRHSAIVWVSSRPWIDEAKEGEDSWGGYSEQRRRIANHIVKEGVENLVIVSGDAHMLAADDGTHSNYADNKDAKGFPVLHAAPLAQMGSSKGGPYSEGCYATRVKKQRQYGILQLRPNGAGMELKFDGYEVSDATRFQQLEGMKPVLKYYTQTPFLAKKSIQGLPAQCEIALAAWYIYLIPLLLVSLIVACCVQCTVLRCCCRRRGKK